MSVFISFGFLVVSGSILINRGGGKFQVKGIAVCSARAQCNIQNNLRDDQNSTQTGDFKNKILVTHKCWWGYGKLELSCIAGENVKGTLGKLVQRASDSWSQAHCHWVLNPSINYGLGIESLVENLSEHTTWLQLRVVTRLWYVYPLLDGFHR